MARQDGDKICNGLLCNTLKERSERPKVGRVSTGSRNSAPSRKKCIINGQNDEGKKQVSTPPAKD